MGKTRGGHSLAGNAYHWDEALNPTIGLESNLWGRAGGGCPLLAMQHDPNIAAEWFYRADHYDATDEITLTQATTGTGAIGTAEPGVLLLDCNSTTQGQGVQIQFKNFCAVPAASKHIWFECCFKIVDTYDKVQLFAGLAEVDTTIIAANAISTSNHIGFYIAGTGAGVMTLAGNKATAADTATFTTIAEATYVRCGFFVNGVTSVTSYLNGVAQSDTIATANVPIVAVFPSFVCQSDGTNDPIMHLRWARCVQLR